MRLYLRAADNRPPDDWIAPPRELLIEGVRLFDCSRDRLDPSFWMASTEAPEAKPKQPPQAGPWHALERLWRALPCSGLHCLIRALWIVLLMACMIALISK